VLDPTNFHGILVTAICIIITTLHHRGRNVSLRVSSCFPHKLALHFGLCILDMSNC